MIKQQIIRVYPRGYGENALNEINDLLNSGWVVKFITPIGNNFHDYVIEKESDGEND